jgi:dihydrofolate reductase
MKLSIVVAMARNRVIGHHNRLPWHLPGDLAHFKAITLGKPIVMGRKTWESIGRALPGRTSIVVTHDLDYEAQNAIVVHSVAAALAAAPDCEEMMVIGGAEFYRQLLPLADTLYLTRVEAEFEGDTYFPELDAAEWREISSEPHAADDRNPWPYRFVTLERVRDA